MGDKVSVDIAELAHRVSCMENNFKVYNGGQTYNGISLTITGTFLGNLYYSTFRPYKTIHGRIFLEIQFSLSGPGTGYYTFVIPEITFISCTKNLPFAISQYGVGTCSGYAVQGSNSIYFYASGTPEYITGVGFPEIVSWPTWADVV
jgi:hypothetical protein